MKQKIIVAIATIALTITSCKKTYTCACTTTVKDSSGLNADVYNDDAKPYTKKMSKKDAQVACDAEKASLNQTYTNIITRNGTSSNGGNTANTECTLN